MWYRIERLLAGSGLLCLLFDGYVNARFAATMPVAPDVVSGRTYLLRVHRSVVYVTHGERLLVDGLFIGSMALFGMGAILAGRRNRKQ